MKGETLHRFPQVLEDGSLHYGNGIIGPSDADQEYFNALEDTPTPSSPVVVISSTSQLGKVLDLATSPWRNFNQRFHGKPNAAIVPVTTAIGVLTAACGPLQDENAPQPIKLPTAATSLAVPKPTVVLARQEIQKPAPTTEKDIPSPKIHLKSPLPADTRQYLNSVHVNGLDVAPQVVIQCTPIDKTPGNETTLKNLPVLAPISGRIAYVGSQNDPTDKNYGAIGIEDEEGNVVTVGHIDVEKNSDPNKQLTVGKELTVGDKIGVPSCKGNTNGIHVHVGVHDKDGNPVPASRILFEGYPLEVTNPPYDGVLKSPDGKIVTTAHRERRTTNVIQINPRTVAVMHSPTARFQDPTPTPPVPHATPPRETPTSIRPTPRLEPPATITVVQRPPSPPLTPPERIMPTGTPTQDIKSTVIAIPTQESFRRFLQDSREYTSDKCGIRLRIPTQWVKGQDIDTFFNGERSERRPTFYTSGVRITCVNAENKTLEQLLAEHKKAVKSRLDLAPGHPVDRAYAIANSPAYLIAYSYEDGDGNFIDSLGSPINFTDVVVIRNDMAIVLQSLNRRNSQRYMQDTGTFYNMLQTVELAK